MTLSARISIVALFGLAFAGAGAQSPRVECIAGSGDGPLGGPARTVKLIEPFGVAFDRSDNAYICEYKGQRISKLDKSGILSLFAGTGKIAYSGDGGPARDAAFNDPHGLVIGRDQQIYVADTLNHRIRKIDLKTGSVTTRRRHRRAWFFGRSRSSHQGRLQRGLRDRHQPGCGQGLRSRPGKPSNSPGGSEERHRDDRGGKWRLGHPGRRSRRGSESAG